MNGSDDSEYHLLSQAWQEARPHLLERIDVFEKLLVAAESDIQSKELALHAHTFSGTLGCFGLDSCSRRAKVLQSMLLRGESRETLLHQAKLLRDVIVEAELSAHKEVELDPVAVFAGPDFPLDELLAFGHSKGVAITPLDDIGPLIGKTWSAVVLDMKHPYAGDFSPDFHLPIVAVVEDDTPEERSRAVLAGARTVCPRDDRLKSLCAALARVFDQSGSDLP